MEPKNLKDQQNPFLRNNVSLHCELQMHLNWKVKYLISSKLAADVLQQILQSTAPHRFSQ